MSSASAGHDWASDLVVLERAQAVRDRDRAWLRRAGRVLRWVALLILPTIVGVALFLPTCTLRFPCRSKQSEAKGNLKALYVAEETYRGEFDRYTTDPVAMGFEPRGARLRYRYFVSVDADGRRFEAIALGTSGDVEGDLWAINGDNALRNVVNACVR